MEEFYEFYGYLTAFNRNNGGIFTILWLLTVIIREYGGVLTVLRLFNGNMGEF
jgi:hypothetical protein